MLATALYGSVPLARSEVSSQDELQSLTTPLAKSLVLSIEQHNSPPVHVTTSHAMMRTIAAWAPALGLLGTTEIDKAWVDGWVSFVWSSLELPFEATQVPEATTVCQEQIHSALAKLNDHLQYQTYLVGDQVTLADITLVVALHNAESRGWSDAAKAHDNVERWYQTMVHQDFIVKALQLLPKLSASTVSTPASSSLSSSSGILMNGVAPPVVNRLFRRNRIRIKEILADEGSMYVGQEVTVAGWARTTRNANKGQLLFVELTDGSTGKSLQCVLDGANTAGFEECKNNGGTGASYQLVGKIIASPAAGQAVECQVTKGEVLGPVYGGDAEGTKIGGALYPLSTKNPTLELYREVAHLRPRGKFHAAAMRIRHAMAYATHTFFHNNGFLYIHTPIITGADCEGAGEQFAVTTMLTNDHLKTGITLPVHEPPPVSQDRINGAFHHNEIIKSHSHLMSVLCRTQPPDPEKKISKSELKRLQKQKEAAAAKADPNKPEDVHVVGAVDYSKDFFSRRVNLTVSGQLNVETHACALSDVYTFGPTFRAENSNTYRHLSEFWMIEPEIAFADLNTDINLAEDYLKYCVEFAMDRCAEDLEFFENHPHGEPGLRERLRNVLDNPFKVRVPLLAGGYPSLLS